MTHRRSYLFAALVVAGLPSSALLAQDGSATFAVPPVVKQLIDCRAITDSAQRLTCYDQRTDALAQAQQSGDLVVADRQEIRKERRGLFGLSLPRLKIFGGGDDEDEVKSFDGVIKSVSNSRGGLRLELQEGGVWEQTDNHYVGTPAAGDPVTISRAAMGSYMAKLKNGAGMRVKRTR